MAEFIFKNLVRNRGLEDQFCVESSAVSDEELGNSIYPPAAACLRSHGIPYDGFRTARKITRDDYDRYDMIVYMDNSNLRLLKRIMGEDTEGKIHSIMSFAGKDRCVTDPWYDGHFENVYSDLLEGCEAILSCRFPSMMPVGTYARDFSVFEQRGIETVELCGNGGRSRVLLVPAYQGRVMTSTTFGLTGTSYGWINRSYIAAGKTNSKFNPFGGEERFWLGPEGGPFSWYFAKGDVQDYSAWKVPASLDTEPFEVVSKDSSSAVFAKRMSMTNASDNVFEIDVERKVSLLDRAGISELLGVSIPESLNALCYRTDNRLANAGTTAWTRESGMPSVWILGMFSPTPSTTVFIPFNASCEGPKFKDDYFGKVPSDRLVAEDGVLYFKIDGKYRAKIGLPSGSAGDICGSYDSARHILTILKYTVPSEKMEYLNAQWGEQDDPFCGDVINSYNDGPTEDGTVMGPFYEIETSSPGAPLKPGESLTHTQFTVHIEGPETELASIVKSVFGIDLKVISAKFRQ